MQSMKGATVLLGSMNRQMNLPALQRIAMEFEKENDIMDQRQEMMEDAVDDVAGLEDEEEGEEVVNQVLDEIGVDLGQIVRSLYGNLLFNSANVSNSSGKPHQGYKRPQKLREEWLRPLGEGILMMRISKQDLIICGGEQCRIPQDLQLVKFPTLLEW